MSFPNSAFLEGIALQLHQTFYNNSKENPPGAFSSSEDSPFPVSYTHTNSKDYRLGIWWRFTSLWDFKRLKRHNPQLYF